MPWLSDLAAVSVAAITTTALVVRRGVAVAGGSTRAWASDLAAEAVVAGRRTAGPTLTTDDHRWP